MLTQSSARTLRGALLLALVLVAPMSAKDEAVRFVNAHRLVPSKESVSYAIRIAPSDSNRWLALEAFDEVGLRVSYSLRQLDGADSPLVHHVNWRLPTGELSLVARVFSADRQELGRATHLVQVVEGASH